MAGRTDAVASWGERAAKLVLWVVGPSALSALAVGAYAWITANPLYGVLFGLIAFAIVQLALMLRAIRRSAARRGPFAEPEPERAIAPAGSQTDPEDAGQLRAQLEEAKQEIERLRIELNNRPPRRFTTPVEIVETLTSAKTEEIERQKAENEELKSENEELKKKLDKRRRKRIEWWRESFDKFDYVNDNVLLSAAYADISEFLQDDIRDALQNRSHVRVELDARTGGSGLIIKGQDPASQKTLLLDEVTRIGREQWERI